MAADCLWGYAFFLSALGIQDIYYTYSDILVAVRFEDFPIAKIWLLLHKLNSPAHLVYVAGGVPDAHLCHRWRILTVALCRMFWSQMWQWKILSASSSDLATPFLEGLNGSGSPAMLDFNESFMNNLRDKQEWSITRVACEGERLIMSERERNKCFAKEEITAASRVCYLEWSIGNRKES